MLGPYKGVAVDLERPLLVVGFGNGCRPRAAQRPGERLQARAALLSGEENAHAEFALPGYVEAGRRNRKGGPRREEVERAVMHICNIR